MYQWRFPGGSAAKNSPAVQEMQVQSLGWKDPLEESMATHPSIFAEKIAWTEESGGLWSMGLQRVGHTQERFSLPLLFLFPRL